ncbi:hypothetical protein FQZ97_587330 [compost metagenome]
METRILVRGLVRCITQQHATQLATQGQGMPGAVQRLFDALQRQGTQGGEQIPATQGRAGTEFSCHEGGGYRQAARRWFISHEPRSVFLALGSQTERG